MRKRIFITGANFSNKGAQSMLFTTVSEIKKRAPETRIYFGTYSSESFDYSQYKFFKASYDDGIQKRALNEEMNIIRRFLLWIKLFENEVLGIRKDNPVDGGRLFSKVDLVIDVSGFALSDKIDEKYNEILLNTIRLAKKNNVPVILMPQSFGPFNYSKNKEKLLDEIKDLMGYPEIIFAREKSGKRALETEIGIENVILSTDMVLQNKTIDVSSIFNNQNKTGPDHITKNNNVAVIPNSQCLKNGNDDHMYVLYKKIINSLLEKGKNVYIVQHSRADMEICETLKKIFLNESRVYRMEELSDCIEFDRFIKNFEFVVCSRYHGCVHAYKNTVPCIILGWADKYLELAELLDQSKFVFSVDRNNDNTSQILGALSEMSDDFASEKEKIKKNLEKIQEESCFDYLDRFFQMMEYNC